MSSDLISSLLIFYLLLSRPLRHRPAPLAVGRGARADPGRRAAPRGLGRHGRVQRRRRVPHQPGLADLAVPARRRRRERRQPAVAVARPLPSRRPALAPLDVIGDTAVRVASGSLLAGCLTLLMQKLNGIKTKRYTTHAKTKRYSSCSVTKTQKIYDICCEKVRTSQKCAQPHFGDLKSFKRYGYLCAGLSWFAGCFLCSCCAWCRHKIYV